MSLVRGAIPCMAAGIGTLTAKAYHATWEQASIFSATDLTVCLLLSHYFSPLNGSLRQGLVIDLTSRIIGCLSGVVATRLVCENTIRWRPAIIAQFATSFSGNFLTRFYLGKSGAMPMKV